MPQAVGGDESCAINKEEAVVKANEEDVEPKVRGEGLKCLGSWLHATVTAAVW